MSRHANARSTDFPATRIMLLARNFDSFVISSAGVTLAFDAPQEAWFLRDDETLAPGTRVALRLRRASSHGTDATEARSTHSSASTRKAASG